MNLMWGSINYNSVPADEEVVRTTATPALVDAPPAMAPTAPDRQEVRTDPNPLLGMVGRQLASKWNQPEQYVPAWAGDVDAQTEHNAIVDRQVSTSGTAAAREMAGQFGHGTMGFAEGIEPVADLVDGGKMTNTYFQADKQAANETAGMVMTPANGLDREAVSNASAVGKDAARKAAERSAYSAFLKGMTT